MSVARDVHSSKGVVACTRSHQIDLGDGEMLIRADVKCYYCGHVSGQIEGNPDEADSLWNYRAGTGAVSSVRHGTKRIRCTRCGGPVFLDEIETVRFPQHLPAAALAVALH